MRNKFETAVGYRITGSAIWVVKASLASNACTFGFVTTRGTIWVYLSMTIHQRKCNLPAMLMVDPSR